MAQQEYDFSQGSIAKNIMSLAVPMTAAQLINVLYSVVDRMYPVSYTHLRAHET